MDKDLSVNSLKSLLKEKEKKEFYCKACKRTYGCLMNYCKFCGMNKQLTINKRIREEISILTQALEVIENERKEILEKIDNRLDELYNNCENYRLHNNCDKCDLIRFELQELKQQINSEKTEKSNSQQNKINFNLDENPRCICKTEKTGSADTQIQGCGYKGEYFNCGDYEDGKMVLCKDCQEKKQ